MVRIFPVLILAFNVWMLVDVYKKRRPQYWYYIIFLLPFGGVIYFFMHKVKDYKWGKWFERPPSLAEVEYRFNSTPSVANQVIFARSLYDDKRCDDALWHFQAVLEKDPDEVDALYGKGRCLMDKREYDQGLACLKRVLALRPSYNDYEIWIDVARGQWDANEREESLATLRKLVRTRSRTDHQAALAQCLVLMEQHSEAQDVIAKALDDYKHSPSHTQRLYRSAAKTLRALKK